MKLGLKIIEKKDPKTGEIKEERDYLPKSQFKSYRENLRREVKASKDIIFRRVDVISVPDKYKKKVEIAEPAPLVYRPGKPESVFGRIELQQFQE